MAAHPDHTLADRAHRLQELVGTAGLGGLYEAYRGCLEHIRWGAAASQNAKGFNISTLVLVSAPYLIVLTVIGVIVSAHRRQARDLKLDDATDNSRGGGSPPELPE